MAGSASDDELVAWALRARDGERSVEWPPRRGAHCPVDLAAFRPGDVAVRLPCGHVMRAECVFPFLRGHREQRRYCPLDGVEVPNNLISTRMRVVSAYDPVQENVYDGVDVSHEACLHWMDVALREAEACIGAEHGDQSLYLAMRSAALLTRRNNYLSQFSCSTVPPEEAISWTNDLVRACDNVEGCGTTFAPDDDITLTSLPCAHWLCDDCDTPRRLRCPACCALRPDGSRAVRWTMAEVFRRENLRLRCGELAMHRLERQVGLLSRDMSEMHRRYAAVTSTSSSSADEVAMNFNALMERFRDTLENPPPREVMPTRAPRSADIAVPAATQMTQEAESWTPPSPGGSPTEGMSNLIVGLRQLLIRNPAQPQASEHISRDEAPSTSPVTDDDTQVCVIDLSEIERGERVIRLPCMHVFHSDCILEYLRSTPRPQCPLDRIDIPRRVIDTLPVFKWGESEVANNEE